jgi:HD-GYP domain-containing protein (c-di-GMP phosphodiesterase class II)
MVSEAAARRFLRALWAAGQPPCAEFSDRVTGDAALPALRTAAAALAGSCGEATFFLRGDVIRLGPRLLPQGSIEFNSMLRHLQRAGIRAISVNGDALGLDLKALAALAAGVTGLVPAGGTVRLNEVGPPPRNPEAGRCEGLVHSYAASLDLLRAIPGDGLVDLNRVDRIVNGFLMEGAGEPGPSLMMATIRSQDESAAYHSVNVCLLSLALGRQIGLGDPDLVELGVGALLHDVGRIILDDPGLTKPGRLSDEDWAQVRLHPQEGALAILAGRGPGQEAAARVSLEHHAGFGGGGYPDLGGQPLHIFSRLVAVADAYDAITSRRPHRPARTPHEALRILGGSAGGAHDPDLVRAFSRMMGVYPPGSLLRLDNGEMVMMTAGRGGRRRALVVGDPAGSLLDFPIPADLGGRRVSAHLLADEVGIEAASLLEAADAALPN